MAIEIKKIVEWLSGWFVLKGTEDRNLSTVVSDISSSLDTKVNTNQGQANKNVVTNGSGLITTEPKINVATGGGLGLDSSTNTLTHSNVLTLNEVDSTVQAKKIKFDTNGHITQTSQLYGSDIPVSSSDSTTITSKIGSMQTDIGNLQSFKFIEVTTTKPTASADTMNKIYIVSETVNDKNVVNAYYTKKIGTSTYRLEKLDENILDEYIVNWNDVQNKPFTSVDDSLLNNSTNPVQNSVIYTALTGKSDTTHGHGYVNTDGTLTTSANSTKKVVVTDNSDKLSVVDYHDLNTGTFSELQSLLGSGNEVVVLKKDYKNSGNESAITVPTGTVIFGNGHTIDADNKSGIFEITSTSAVNVTFIDIVFANGKAVKKSGASWRYGGAIYNTCYGATVLNCEFVDNIANHGGAIYTTVPMTIKDCYFTCSYSQVSSIDNLLGLFVESSYTDNFSIYNCHNDFMVVLSSYSSAEYINVTNVPYLTEHQSLSNYIQKSSTSGLVKNDGTIETHPRPTSIVLVPQSTDNTGTIKIYYGDEPSNS